MSGRLSCLLLLPCVMAFAACAPTEPAPTTQPNILMISVDDLNNWIEPLGGHPQAQTPNFAAFARQSMVFTRSFAASPSCNPSRTALMTGKAPHVTGVYQNPQIWRHILPNEVTLPQYFRNAGYWAGGAGKNFHNNMPDPISWDDYFPSKIRHMPEYFLPELDPITGQAGFTLQDNEIREDDPKGVTFTMPPFDRMYIAFDFAPLPVSVEETGDYSSVKWISDQLKKSHDKPFFLAAGLYRPHLPWYVPQEFYDKFPLDQVQLPKTLAGDQGDLPEGGKRTANTPYHQKVEEAGLWREAVQGYLASINYADHLVGELLQALEDSEYADNTIVVIYSDHGWQLGEKEHWRKFALWQNVLNTVMMVKVPDGIEGMDAGVFRPGISNRGVSLVDIFPTLTELAGLPAKAGITGQSLVPLLKEPDAAWDRPVVSVLGDKNYSVIQGDWHLIRYDDEAQYELYNMADDPEEWTNLASLASQAERIRELESYIPTDRAPSVRTAPIRWADVLSGETKFYQD
ncbi:MAG: arylsulfatase A-like enzyme [Rhodothermales bacterium]